MSDCLSASQRTGEAITGSAAGAAGGGSAVATADAAPCFDKDHWPQQPDERWHRSVHAYYRSSPYWD